MQDISTNACKKKLTEACCTGVAGIPAFLEYGKKAFLVHLMIYFRFTHKNE